MYGENISIEFFKMMPLLDLNLLYTKVVKHEMFIFVLKTIFKSMHKFWDNLKIKSITKVNV